MLNKIKTIVHNINEENGIIISDNFVEQKYNHIDKCCKCKHATKENLILKCQKLNNTWCMDINICPIQ